MCEDALAVYREFKSRGGEAPKRPYVGNHLWVAPLTDPDRYPITFESSIDSIAALRINHRGCLCRARNPDRPYVAALACQIGDHPAVPFSGGRMASVKSIQRILMASALCLVMRTSAQSNAGWDSVKRIAADELIRIRSAHRVVVCNFESADDERLVSSISRTRFFVPIRSREFLRRSDVQSVRISRRGWSTIAATGIGLGIGVGFGAAVDASARDQVEEGHLMAVLSGFFGGLTGLGIGHYTDFLAGPIIYRAP